MCVLVFPGQSAWFGVETLIVVFFSRSIERCIRFAFMRVSIAGSYSLSISRETRLHRFLCGFRSWGFVVCRFDLRRFMLAAASADQHVLLKIKEFFRGCKDMHHFDFRGCCGWCWHYARQHTKNVDGFVLGGRNVGPGFRRLLLAPATFRR